MKRQKLRKNKQYYVKFGHLVEKDEFVDEREESNNEKEI